MAKEWFLQVAGFPVCTFTLSIRATRGTGNTNTEADSLKMLGTISVFIGTAVKSKLKIITGQS